MAYLSLSTANLPDPAIDPAAGKEPSDYFNTVLYTGNGSTQSITGVGHQPDFLWFKNRNGTQVHQLFDVVRGVAGSLRSNGTDAENIDSPNDRLTSFDSDGFSLGDDGNPNGSSNTYVAWSWKAGGTGVSNTEGSITSTVSANTDAGFSIVSYTGTGANATVGHSLNQKPEVIFFKNRDASGDFWYVYHHSVPTGSNSELQALYLNDNDAASEFGTGAFMNNTAPTTSVFSLDTNGGYNRNNEDIIAYCFHSVEGYSKCSSYVGNGSSDGPFIYTGFRPSFILYKSSSHTRNWGMNDAVRNTFNVVDEQLLPNSSGTTSESNEVDYLSNGFKLRSTDTNSNASGYTYIYMAFAENPFKYSNAR